ncbi:alanine/glycine:cation symporter family protein [Kocuria tytonis]|uniref:Sodium:alanine symporter family protein n=1 Tax=Kocuria tytonis TaxID=2054280 RepID=A0A495A8M4_9MICC|nr:sodium:alanine symporter family protein [Kocuria tytonis]RKQ34827.1 sodium:alanine symporter family protein [Kocuria tytonis]
MDTLQSTLDTVRDLIWGPWLLLPLLFGTGVFMTFRLRGIQIRFFTKAMSLGFGRRSRATGEKGDISSFAAMSTALAATVGTGNIVGVAAAMSIGGPGALFWMWITALFGMASKYAECFLGVRFRTRDTAGHLTGGPQVYLARGIPNKFGRALSVIFAVCCVVATFGIGNMTQGNAIASNLDHTFHVAPIITAVVLAVGTGLALLGGIQSIAKITTYMVPLMIVLYIGSGLYIIGVNFHGIPEALRLIFTGAFTPMGATGGFVGSTVLVAMRMGAARSLFSNESGMGTASIAASIAQTSHPVRQGLVSMTQTFVDTLVVISITGFVILTTGMWNQGDTATMTSRAFATGLPGSWGGTIVTICLVLLGYSTVLGWAYYGERNVERLAGARAAVVYRVVFSIAAGLGALAPLTLVWTFSDIMNGLMAIPNLIGLIILSGLVVRETKLYLEHDPKFNATTEEIDAFMGTHPGALDAQIHHTVDLSSSTPALSETGSAPAPAPVTGHDAAARS